MVVEDDPEMRRRVVELIGDGAVKVDEAATGGQAIDAMRSTQYDCVILDIGLPDMDGRELLKRLGDEKAELPPIIIHTARISQRNKKWPCARRGFHRAQGCAVH